MNPPGGPGTDPPCSVVLTTGSHYGRQLLAALAARGVPPALVLVPSEAALQRCFRATGWRRAPELPLALARSLRRAWRARATARALARLPGLARSRVRVTGPRNSGRMRRDLATVRPDLLVLGGIGLLDGALLAIPRWGTVNGHPGLLPWVRGNGVVVHALLRAVPLGATCHRVDAGIDRGPILERRLLPVADGDGLVELEWRSLALAATLVADVVADAIVAGALPDGIVQHERWPLCRWATPAERSQAETAVRDGEAARLFDRWREACAAAGAPWRLPDVVPSPPADLPPASATPGTG